MDDRVRVKGARRPGLSLIEVVVSTVILGVVSIAYSATMRGQVMQRDAYEDLAIAMEMTARQIEYLRAMDVKRAKSATDPNSCPFNSVFNNYGAPTAADPCMGGNNLPYGDPDPSRGELDFDMTAGAVKSVIGGGSALALEFLTGVPFTEPPAALTQTGNAVVFPARFTVGAPQGSILAPIKPLELWMPTMYLVDARNYTAVVRATRVRAGLEGGNPVQPYQALLHFQITVFKGEAGRLLDRRPVLVTNYLREADLR